MKKKYWLGFLSFIILLTSHTKLLAGNNVQLSGLLPENCASYKITVDNYFVGLRTKNYEDKTKLGHFSIGLEITKPLFVELKAGAKSWLLYVEPGDEFDMDFTGPTPVFNGKNAGNNRLLSSFLSSFGNDGLDSSLIERMMVTLVDVTEMDLYDSKKKQEAFLKKEMKESEQSPDFRMMMKAMVRYRYLSGLLAWSVLRAEREHSAIKRIPQVMVDDMDQGPFENEKLMALPSFRNYLYMRMAYCSAEANGFAKFPDESVSYFKRYEYAAQNLKGNILSWYLGSLMINECGIMAPSIVKRLHTELVAIDRTFFYSAVVFEKCGEAINRKEEKVDAKEVKELKDNESGIKLSFPDGGSSGGVKLVTTDGKGFSISSLKGKVVYVDIWASWCGPCRGQFPYSKALKESLTADQSKGIVFLYISIDQNETAWRNAIEQFKLDGLQTLSPGGWSSDICQEYGVTSIPRYLIFDKKGKLTHANAPRPSDPTVKDILLNLLMEK